MCPLGSGNKENVFYDTPVKDYLRYIATVGAIPMAITPSSSILKQVG